MCQTQSSTDCPSTIGFSFTPLIWVTLALIPHPCSWPVYITAHKTFPSHGYPTDSSNSVHWNWIYHLCTHTCSSCFSHLRGEETPNFQSQKPKGYPWLFSFPHLHSVTKYCWFLCMDTFDFQYLLSCPAYLAQALIGHSNSYRSFGLPSQSIHHIASRITFLIMLLVKVTFQRLSVSGRVKSEIHSKQDCSGPSLPSASLALPLALWKARVCFYKFTKLVTLSYSKCLPMMFSPSWKVLSLAPSLNFSM